MNKKKQMYKKIIQVLLILKAQILQAKILHLKLVLILLQKKWKRNPNKTMIALILKNVQTKLTRLKIIKKLF